MYPSNSLLLCLFVYTYRAHSSRVMFLDVGTERSVAGVSPGVQRGLTLIRLRITGLLTQVIKTERPAAPWVKEASLTQVPMLRNQNL